MLWSDFTNKVLTKMGKFVLLPLVVIGALLVLSGEMIGIALLFGGCVVFLLVALTLVVFKPLLVKKYPESKSNTPLPDKYIVDQSVPYEELSLIQKLAVDQFEGDVVLAWEYVFTHEEKEKQVEYTKTINEWEACAAYKVIKAQMNEKFTDKEFNKAIEVELILDTLEMTEEQVLMYEENPFFSDLWKWIGVLLLTSVAIGVVIGLGHRYIRDESAVDSVAALLGCGTTFVALKVVGLLLKGIRFHKAKRILQQLNEKR